MLPTDTSEPMRSRVPGRRVEHAQFVGSLAGGRDAAIREAIADGYVAVAENGGGVLLQRFARGMGEV